MARMPSKASFVVNRLPNRAQMGQYAAQEAAAAVASLLKTQDTISMIFAAAPSQNEFLEAFISDPRVDFTRIIAFHMDEYVGLAADAPQRFGNFLKARLFDRAPFKAVHYLGGDASADPAAECARYAALMAQFPVDIVCMGIGENGHIAFNDPHVALLDDPEPVKIVELDQVCRMQQVNDGCFAQIDQVPTHAMTLTIPTLLNAKHHFCMVPAATKAQAVLGTVYGPIGMDCPASALRLCADVRLYIDEDSGAKL